MIIPEYMLENILRIVLAMVIGGIIGWEREANNRPAGLRTHMLVSIGAAVIMIMGQMSLYKYADLTTLDPTRLGAQVISGIGFLGAGCIMREGLTIKGLTTAASLWAVACLGLAAGGGFYDVAAAGTIAILITLTLFEYLESKFKKEKGLHVELKCTDVSATLINIKSLATCFEGTLKDIDVSEEEADGKVVYYLVCKIYLMERTRKKIDYSSFASSLSALPGVAKVAIQEF